MKINLGSICLNVKKSLKVYLEVIRQSKNKRLGQTDLAYLSNGKPYS